ncbi:zf-HC2 domain-containing protein [Kitasatospora sp. NBC_01287]|uniref:zf-HC2 domain-containing protein n=1 Tax=Kitasatospora sp. NBC_01287 TaxID=2903573 RepID=UPI002254B356|nr:zf-HC2 domain-containing protein [Kitasatospora sp. NBC_01287]MCX4745204.1 zf-HC2 domain-containing protein [Kitasatospora sp. NBC_01287]
MSAEQASHESHASTRLIDAYARGDTEIAADTLWALEAHLEACAPCRGRLAASVATGAPGVAALVDTVRASLEPRLDAAVPMPSRRYRPRWVSAWVTPVMAPWLAMIVAVVAVALLLDAVGSTAFGAASPELLIAPVLPLCAVAASWSRGLDPAHELTASTARAGLPLLLRRTTSVLAVVLPVLLVQGWLTGAMTVAQWLLPSLAFTATALALGSFVGVTRAAAGLVVAWGVVLAAPAWDAGRVPVLLRPDQLPVWGALLVLGIGAVIARRRAYSSL